MRGEHNAADIHSRSHQIITGLIMAGCLNIKKNNSKAPSKVKGYGQVAHSTYTKLVALTGSSFGGLDHLLYNRISVADTGGGGGGGGGGVGGVWNPPSDLMMNKIKD